MSVFDRLCELVAELEQADPLGFRHVYLNGRIDECCRAHGISDADRDKAVAAVSAALRERQRAAA